MEDEKIEKLRERIQDIKVAMLTTVDEDGKLHSRPMATEQVASDGTLWFFTRADSPKIKELAHDERVNVSYSDPDDDTYVSIAGRARVVRDRERAAELWSPLYKAWFPQGLDDPELALVNVRIEQAQYWDRGSRKMVELLQGGSEKLDLTG